MIAEHTQRDIKKARLMRGGLIFLKSETVYNRELKELWRTHKLSHLIVCHAL